MRFTFVLALLPLFAACNSTNSTATTSSEKIEPDQEFEVITLKYASATELADTIEELVEAARRAGAEHRRAQSGGTGSRSHRSETVRVLADRRTNSLLVTAPSSSMIQIKDLVAALDVELTK